jgi:hypothetical protein
MNKNVETLVLNTIEEFVENWSLFTAYDVTLTVREGTTQNVRHHEVRDFVHQQMAQNSEYTKALIHIPNASGDTYLFYPLFDSKGNPTDISTYDPNWVKQAAPTNRFVRACSAPAVPAALAPLALTDDTGEDKDQLNLTSRDRICVPARFIRQIGLKHGDRVFVQVQSATHSLKLLAYEPNVSTASYLVEKDDGVRLIKSLFDEANLAIPIALSKINADQNSITIG